MVGSDPSLSLHTAYLLSAWGILCSLDTSWFKHNAMSWLSVRPPSVFILLAWVLLPVSHSLEARAIPLLQMHVNETFHWLHSLCYLHLNHHKPAKLFLLYQQSKKFTHITANYCKNLSNHFIFKPQSCWISDLYQQLRHLILAVI